MILSDLPILPRRQDSVTEQLVDLKDVATRLGMYDAADYIQNRLDEQKIPRRHVPIILPHPFVATPDGGKCSSCGKGRSDDIHKW